MFRDDKNLKDPQKDSEKDTSSMPAPYQASGLDLGSYTKTNKLITALYMVTDIMDKDEPLRNKLRVLGAEIISDMNSSPLKICNKITEIMSFLDIALAVNIISEMNGNILRKEFRELDHSIKESWDKKMDLGILFENSSFEDSDPYLASPLLRRRSKEGVLSLSRGREIHKGHTRIGVQKGSTLLQALSAVSDRNIKTTNLSNFDALKKQRREDITNFIIRKEGGATITDIKNGTQGSLASCSEKTLQRELMSMIKDGVLNKTGEKRWSRYFMK